MKTNNKARNIFNNGVYIVIVIVFSIIIAQSGKMGKRPELLTQIKPIEKIKQEIETEKETIEVGQNNNEIVTSRHSLVRGRKSEEINVENIEEQYAKLEDIKISRDMDLSVRTGISKEDFKELISRVKYDTSKFFFNNSDMIYDLCEEYQINEIFFCGLISAESGWNIASNHRRTHNYISLMTKKGLIYYESVEVGLTAAAKALHNNYLTEGGRFYHGKTLYGVKTKFCPASSTWVELVYGRMQQITKCI